MRTEQIIGVSPAARINDRSLEISLERAAQARISGRTSEKVYMRVHRALMDMPTDDMVPDISFMQRNREDYD